MEVDLTPHQVIGLVLHVGDVEKSPRALGLESMDPFLRVSKQGQCFSAMEEEHTAIPWPYLLPPFIFLNYCSFTALPALSALYQTHAI